MSLFGKVKRIINESKILLEKDSDALKQFKKSKKSFEKGFGKNIKPTVVQPGLDLYKAGGPFIPDKTTFKDTGKKVPRMEPKPQFGKSKPVTKTGAPDKTLLKKAISDVKASEKRLFDKGLGKGTAGIKGVKGKPGISLARQRKYTIDKIKELSAKTTQSDARVRGSSTEGTAGAGGSSKTTKPKVTPTKGVKQSEVSKQAKDFNKNINQANKNRKEFAGDKKSFTKFAKEAETAKNKLRKQVDKIAKNPNLTGKEKSSQSRPVMRNVKIAQDFERGYKSNPTNAVVRTSDLDMIKKTTKPNKPVTKSKEPKNKTIKFRKDRGTYKTAGGDRVTTGMGAGAQQKVTYGANDPDLSRMSPKDRATYQRIKNTTKKGGIPKWMKEFDKKYPIKPIKSFKKAATPAAKAFSKAGPIGKIAGAALVAGGAIYGANQIRKAFAGAGKPKTVPSVKGSALRYKQGVKINDKDVSGKKKYFDLKSFRTNRTFTKSDLKDADFGKPDRDEKLIKRLKSTK